MYGRTLEVGHTDSTAGVGNVGVAQHKGIGLKLLEKAEEIAELEGFPRIAVISGIGVQNYYKKFGYRLDDGDGKFMVKSLISKNFIWLTIIEYTMICIITICLVFICSNYFL